MITGFISFNETDMKLDDS